MNAEPTVPDASPRTVELSIGGMTCASCAARIEKQLNKLPGVEAAVNLAAEKAHLRSDPALADTERLIAAIVKAGFTATPSTADTRAEEKARKEAAYPSFTVEATGTVPMKGLWDTAIDLHVVYQLKNPNWTLEWGQPGNKVGKLEFGNVFWGERDQLVLEWEGGYKPANPEAINFKLPPGGQEVYLTAEYEDFNMNHKADWFKSIREGHHRPAVDIEIAHRTATICNLGNLSMILGRKLVWDGKKQEVVRDEAANRMLSRPQRYPYVM